MRVIITHAVLATLASATAIPAVPVTAYVATTHTINRVCSLAIIASERAIVTVRMLVEPVLEGVQEYQFDLDVAFSIREESFLLL